MKAFKAREMSIKPQYKEASKYITSAVMLGKTSVILNLTAPLYPEVAEMLAKDGYDVKIVHRKQKCFSYNEISWLNAEEGQEGKVTYINEDET